MGEGTSVRPRSILINVEYHSQKGFVSILRVYGRLTSFFIRTSLYPGDPSLSRLLGRMFDYP